MSNKQYHTLRLILGDQLNASHSWYRSKDKGILYLIAELPQECDYTLHHGQKICAFFSAMEQFANGLSQSGHDVLHLTLDQTAKYTSLKDCIFQIIKQYSVETFDYQRPDEYRLLTQLRTICTQVKVQTHEYDSEHFIVDFHELKNHFKANTAHRMEAFYRRLRKAHDILMDGNQPLGGQWNYDTENRNKLKPSDLAELPKPLVFGNDVGSIIARLKRHNIKFFGQTPKTILWPTNRQQALELLDYFCSHLLVYFGRFQDAMTDQSDSAWSLYHSRLSFALNTKMISPERVIQQALSAHKKNPTLISLAQIEGFVRQILGWREFVRGIYWANMPEYARKNSLEANRELPAFFWTGKTQMNCLEKAITQSLDTAYAHHIQRLMITGNFCLLTGVNPEQVDQWYLGIYIDAIEWVELPNTRGMSQYADGGLLASKPYCASANYINKMSDYCQSCHYDHKLKTGPKACPFNSLYWHFMNRHKQQFSQNPRLSMTLKNFYKQPTDQQKAILDYGQWCLDHLEQL